SLSPYLTRPAVCWRFYRYAQTLFTSLAFIPIFTIIFFISFDLDFQRKRVHISERPLSPDRVATRECLARPGCACCQCSPNSSGGQSAHSSIASHQSDEGTIACRLVAIHCEHLSQLEQAGLGFYQ